MPAPTDTQRQAAGRRSTLVSVAVNIVLTTLQMVVGVLAHSQALVADAIHSLSDLVSDGVVLVANKHSHKAPDAEHPYGHRRFETAASMAIGALLLAVGIGMLARSFNVLQTPAAIPEVHAAALVIALLALASKELLFRYMLRVARRVRSSMLVANAWHARSDAASSLVVALGILANLSGLHLADPLAALVVGLMIIRMGWKFFYAAFNDLMDAAVDDETEGRIRQHILDTPGVLGIHALKTRKMGDMIWVEVDIEMDGDLTITEGHAIAVAARDRVMEKEPVLDVMTHFDPVKRPLNDGSSQTH
ncbi:cation diffusion facilitator family transporter [Allopusillimonas ginsengisoli]|uniref:cation diffusion facilitator family transporter n=1 Tax=Allopusillimonas ginsengisoli TaxID=453575 RepID=UPI00102210D4|nr:cation diffusion facilitator family transporter [Allopusillimonas ginsengisoli]TEA74111.1 cation transporter [Allopusillimonas ginsengisoli]